MKVKIIITLIIVWALSVISIHAQFTVNGKVPVYDKNTQTYLISIPKKTFNKDYEANFILQNDTEWRDLTIDGQSVSNSFYTFHQVSANKLYCLTAYQNNDEIKRYITFTYLPILNIKGTFGYEYTNGNMFLSLPDTDSSEQILIKAKWRGGSTNTAGKHKRNYKIKTINENGKSKDYSLLGMRKDNNWILDAGQVDLFRMRNRIATELWNDFSTKPYYANEVTDVQTGVNGRIVEVVLNDEYYGIYSLTEAMDRKELKLKKYDENDQSIHGQLWKASGYGYSTFWEEPDTYDNYKETWNVFETKYPDIEDVCPTDYSLLRDAIYFTATSDDATFSKNASEYFDIPVLIDYYIFLQVINGIDNIGKNMYWAVYDKTKDKKLTPAIWDLDATTGQYYTDSPLHPAIVNPDNKLSITALNIYNRLINLNVDGIVDKIRTRYNSLRKTYLETDSLIKRYYEYYELIANCGANIREANRWSYDTDIAGNKLDFYEEFLYIKEWIKQRITYLDNEININTAIKNTAVENRNNIQAKYNLLGQKIKYYNNGIYIQNGKKYTTK